MKNKILIVLSIIILIFVFFIVMYNIKSDTDKKQTNKIATTSKNDIYIEEDIITTNKVNAEKDKSNNLPDEIKTTSSSTSNGLKSKEIEKTTKSENIVVEKTTSNTYSQKNSTTKNKQTTTSVTEKNNQCISKSFSSPFFRGDFKNDEKKCHSTGSEFVEKTNGKHFYECEYEYDNCNEKW